MLAPVHIVFLQLVIDPVCSIVFESERERTDLMHMPPRRPGTRLLTHKALIQHIGIGAFFALIVLCVYAVLLKGGQDVALARTIGFLSIMIANILMIFAVRILATERSERLRGKSNPALWVVLGVTGSALLLIMISPFLARLFGLVPLLAF